MHTKGPISGVPENSSIHNQVASALNISLPAPFYLMYIQNKGLTFSAINSTDIGKLITEKPIKVHIDPTKLLPKIPQYSLKPEERKDSNT